MGASRYWRLSGLQTPSNTLALTALALSDGTTDYPSATLTGELGPGFKITWDLGTLVDITVFKLTANSPDGFPAEMLVEESTDGVVWVVYAAMGRLTYLGAGLQSVVSVGDGFYNQTPLILHFDGANNSTTFTNNGATALTTSAAGDAKLSTAQSRFGGASLALDGSGDFASVGHGSPSAFAFGTGDFTIECFVRYVADAQNRCIWGFDESAPMRLIVVNGALQLHGPGGGTAISGASGLDAASFKHVATQRVSGVVRNFVDGVQVGADWAYATALEAAAGGALRIGCNRGDTWFFNGNIDEFRITRGWGRYNHTGFTAPAAPFPDTLFQGQISARVVTGAPTSLDIGRILGSDTPPPSNRYLDAVIGRFDSVDGGTGRIVGTVKEKALPANLSLQRRVMLLDEATRRTICEVWSDASTGAYTFNNVAMDRKYTVVSYDHTGIYRAVIADNLSPEPMP